MELKVKDVANILNVSEKTVNDWVKERKIPFIKVNNQIRFYKNEINEWVIKNQMPVSEKIMDLSQARIPANLYELLVRGGIYYDVKGKNVEDVLKNAIKTIPTPEDISKNMIIEALLKREELMTTAMGKGIAIPHPRNPIITHIENESVSICLLKNEVDFRAMDKVPVHTLFVILSANPKRHLEILSKISYLSMQTDFIALLQEKAETRKILSYILECEEKWKKQ